MAPKPSPNPSGAQPWYLLIHQLPPEPLYLRAKIRQRLSRVGAVALKNAVYVLPRRDECLEDFEWIAGEALSGGGEAYVCEARFLGKTTDEALVARFRSERDADYAALAETLGAPAPGEGTAARMARARARFSEIVAIDFFGAPGRRRVEDLLKKLEKEGNRTAPVRGSRSAGWKGKVWVTRPGVKVDRIATAWLVRRFLDAKARFRFADPGLPRRSGELSFDMVGGDFTHEGDRCTFETLLARTGLRDQGLSAIAEIVHDIDVKDGKFARPEAAGVARMLEGLLAAHPGDNARLERGRALFDGLYASFGANEPAAPRRRPRGSRTPA